MKKNYLLVALMSALVVSGCNGGSTSSSSAATSSNSSISSSSSSSSEAKAPTVADAVAKLALDYTVNYTDLSTGDEYSVLVEDTEDESEAYYFMEKTNDGYYLDANGDAYYFYMNGFNKPIYNTAGKLDSANSAALRSVIDIKASFTDASWDLVSEGNTYVYYTEDAEVVNTCVFLTDGAGANSADSVEVTLSNRGKITGFATFDASGDKIADAELKRLGTTYAVEEAPVLDDAMDQAFVNRWVIATENNTKLGTMYDMFEVYEDGTLIKYDVDEEGYATVGDVYSFVTPTGDGYYGFQNAAGDIVLMYSFSGYLIFATMDAATQQVAQSYAVSYYELMFLTYAESLGYVVEAMTEDDELYAGCVTELHAAGAYYVAEVDENGEATDIMIVTQFVTIPQMIDEYFDGDVTLYNGCSLGGYIYANFAVTAAASQESILMMYDITAYLQPEYAAVDSSRYIEAEAGVTALDYLIAAMAALGYSYNNAANPGNYAGDITKIIEANNSLGEGYPACTDVYVFHDASGQFACVIVFDNIVALWGSYGLTNVTTIGYGYFAVIGEIYGALTTWGNAQPVPTLG